MTTFSNYAISLGLMKPWARRLLVLAMLALKAVEGLATEPPDQEYELHFYPEQIAIMPLDPAFNVIGDEVTVEAWLMFESGRLQDDVHVMCFQNAVGFRHDLDPITGPGLFFFAHTSVRLEETKPRVEMEADTWIHVAGVYDGSNLRLYFDGVEVAMYPHTGDLALGGPDRQHCSLPDVTLFLGAGWRGPMRQVRLWNRALSAGELLTNSQLQLSGTEEGLVAYYPLDDGHETQLATEQVTGMPLLARGNSEVWEMAINEPEWWLTNPQFLVHEDWAEDMAEDTATPFLGAEVADVNGDGMPDLVVGAPDNQCPGDVTTPIRMLINDGTGRYTFDAAAVFDGPVPEAEQARRILVRDFNGDNRADFFIADHGDDCDFLGARDVLVYSSGTDKMIDVSDTILAPPCTDTSPDPVGEKPCWIGGSQSGQFNVKRYPADGAFVVPPPGFSHAAAAGDIDGDGDVDIYVGNTAEARPYFLLNDGSGSFEVSWEIVPDEFFETDDFGQPLYPTNVALIADMDNDGHNDLVFGPEAGNQLPDGYFDGWIVWNPGNGDFSTANKTSLPRDEDWPFVAQAQPLAFDIDGDNDLDLILPREGQEPSRLIQILVNQASRIFEDQTATRIPVQAFSGLFMAENLRAIDLNDDGCLDLQVELNLVWVDGGPHVYLNDCSGNFTHLEADILGKPRKLFPLDADQDGDLDFLSIEVIRPFSDPEGYYLPIAVLEKRVPDLEFYHGFEGVQIP